MAAKQNAKRRAPASVGASKKRKLASNLASDSRPKKYVVKPKEKGKEKAADREIIPIPEVGHEDDVELSDQDLEVLEEYGGAASFLTSLDRKGISRSKKETERLHSLTKPVRQHAPVDDLPSIDSHDEDEGYSDSDTDDSLGSADEDEEPPSDEDSFSSVSEDASDIEMEYEKAPRKRRPSWESQENQGVKGLPIKLPDGRIQSTGTKLVAAPVTTDDEESEEAPEAKQPERRVDDVATGARFGRPAVIDVVGNTSRAERVHGAKEQIAGICQEILADPENSLGLLRRLHTFSLAQITTPTHPDPIPNDSVIRKLAILSQVAVFKDIIPGYRIRPLTDKEKAEKVSQIVARTREWEQGLVIVYQNYLRSLEAELKARSELADIALKCMCTLLAEVTHFNFRVNLMSCIVARLSKKSWDQMSDLCLSTLIRVFREDLTGAASLEVVRLLNRMVKEKHFNIHPEVLSCLLHLRLKTELDIRASESTADKPQKLQSRSKAAARRAKGKSAGLPHLSKKAKNALREKQAIDKELREAEAEVDKEERAVTQTETLKLLFVLYFRIIKNPRPTPLLPAALHGISKFAHLVNIDFFKDLMEVLKELISRESQDEEDVAEGLNGSAEDIRHRLRCIVTAFELLSGQGEALNIDLSDFISCLYALILPLSLMMDIEAAPPSSFASEVRPPKTQSLADMLFRALTMVFSPRAFGAAAPPGRSAAFAKRLLTASLHWPPATTLRTLDFVAGLIAKDAKLEALLSTDDRTFDGVYRPNIDDPQLCHPFGTSFWELHVLHENHWDAGVREQAGKVLNTARS
ncbi:putative nucleolar complex-associated protein 3 [Lyophyllum shimeji]|uniref:Nucleolar complex-associated protein 3 n=1 Tax=Lyophyllum shimeji TaxID=47721 RepID=A0A9P3PFD0_LYOSH|nr:putative nucleolar complex-associated protein 3 [Lyophyllum shimeji]